MCYWGRGLQQHGRESNTRLVTNEASRQMERGVACIQPQRLSTPYARYPESANLDVADGDLEVVQVLLQLGVLLGHLLVLGLPLVTLRLEGLDLALVVAGLDIGLAEPVDPDRLARSVYSSENANVIK